MTQLRGVGIGLGVAQGPVARMAPPLPAPDDAPSTLSVEEETTRARDAVGAVARELEARGMEAGGAAQEVLEAQAMMAEDPTLEEEIDNRLSRGKTAEWAVHDAFASFRQQLTALGGYLGERAADLDDVAQRVIAQLRGEPAPGVPDPGHPFVLVAKDLAPADTALLDLDKVLALVTTEGGPTSHTAILAREKSIVAIVGASGAKNLVDGEPVIVDAASGVVTTEPTTDELDRAATRARARAEAANAPLTPGALADGTAVPLLANLGSPAAAAEAVDGRRERASELYAAPNGRQGGQSGAGDVRGALSAFQRARSLAPQLAPVRRMRQWIMSAEMRAALSCDIPAKHKLFSGWRVPRKCRAKRSRIPSLDPVGWPRLTRLGLSSPSQSWSSTCHHCSTSSSRHCCTSSRLSRRDLAWDGGRTARRWRTPSSARRPLLSSRTRSALASCAPAACLDKPTVAVLTPAFEATS